jgi:hypothetical protein
MKVLLDTCVIYPTVMRQMLLGVAKEGVFTPLWSARIIEEWQRAAVKLGPEGVAQAGAEATMLSAQWPADMIITLNTKDFPRNILAEEGLSRTDPDGFLHGVYQAQPDLVAQVGAEVLAEANRLSGNTRELRALLKKARLPRIAKALS